MNWPNGLTVGRLVLGPVVLICLLSGRVRLAFYLFVIAMFTDLYDGYLARRSNSVTEFGKLMDPLADKVVVSLVLVGLVVQRLPYLPIWMVSLIIGREILILGCRTGVFKTGVPFVTSRIAKWKTAAQMIWVASVLLYMTVLSHLGLPVREPTGHFVESILWIFGTVAAALTLISGAEYLMNGRGLASARVQQEGSPPGKEG